MTVRLLCSLLLLTLSSAVSAQQPPGRLSFSATLESIKVSVRPNDVVTRQFRLTLDPGQPTTRFHAKVEDWWRSEDGAQSHYAPPGTISRSCARWVSINPIDSVVEAGETLVIRLTASVPTEVVDGGYWCVLTVDEVPDPEAADTGVGVKFLASVATGIFLYLGDIERAASIQDLRVVDGTARVTVRNDGNAPISVEGRLEFLAAGEETAAATMPLPRTTVLTEPVTQSVISAHLPPPSVLPPGRYRLRAVLDFGADHLIGAEREVEVTAPGGEDDIVR